MKITVYVENYSIQNDWITIGEFTDIYHTSLFIKSVLDDREENNIDKTTLKIVYEN